MFKWAGPKCGVHGPYAIHIVIPTGFGFGYIQFVIPGHIQSIRGRDGQKPSLGGPEAPTLLGDPWKPLRKLE